MRKWKNSLAFLALVGAGASAGTAHAWDAGFGIGGFYLGGAAAYTEADRAGDESGIGTHVYAGADLFRIPAIARFGVEVGHVRTREIEGTFGSMRISNTSVSAKAAWTTLPLIDLHGRFGYEDGDTSGAIRAFGFTLKPAPVLGVRAEYARHRGFDAYTLGLRVRFR
jgi:hypothetical protein